MIDTSCMQPCKLARSLPFGQSTGFYTVPPSISITLVSSSYYVSLGRLGFRGQKSRPCNSSSAYFVAERISLPPGYTECYAPWEVRQQVLSLPGSLLTTYDPKAVDVWSASLTILEMATGILPVPVRAITSPEEYALDTAALQKGKVRVISARVRDS